MRKVVFIGNRPGVLEVLLKQPKKYQVKALVLENSPLHSTIESFDVPYQLFSTSNKSKAELLGYLQDEQYDLLVSNGCPFILPVSALLSIHAGTLFINTHPTYLPHLKGKTPLNGVFYLGYNFIGATTHYMDDGVDTGNIIYQKKIDLTPDIDQGLVYFLSFKMEAEVFQQALNILELNNFSFTGEKQVGSGSYFNRHSNLFSIDFKNDTDDNIVKKVSSVGIKSQGIQLYFNDKSFIVFEAEKMLNTYLKGLFNNTETGALLLAYSNRILVKTKEGIIKFSYAG